MWKPQSHGSIADWLGRVGRGQPGVDWAPSPVHTSFHVSTTTTPRGRKSSSPGETPPRTVWKPQPHGSIADWLGRVGRGQPGEDRAHSPVQTSFHVSTTPTPRGRKSIIPESTPPRTVCKPQFHGLIANWLGRVDRGQPGKDRACTAVVVSLGIYRT